MERTRRTRQPDAWTGQIPPDGFRLRLTFAERTAFPQVVKSTELVQTQALAEVELERCGWSDSYRLVCWLPLTPDLRVSSVITLGGIEWVVRLITPRQDRYRLSPGGPAAGILRLADTAGV